MQTIDDYVPVTSAKTNLLEFIRQIKDHDRCIGITKNGVPEAVMISMSRFDGLLETIDILSDDAQMQSIRKSINDAQNDRWIEVSVDE